MILPDKKYSVIYADPPWSYRQCGTGPKSRGNAAQHYHTMTTDDICALPVHSLAGGVRRASCGPHSHKLPTLCELWRRGGLSTRPAPFLDQEKSQEQHEFLGHGSVHKGKRRNLPAGRDTRIQGSRSDQKPCRTSSDRVTDSSAQRKAG